MAKSKILLINPYIYDFAAYDLWLKPLGLLYLASILEENGCDVILLDAMDRWDTNVLALQKRETPKSRAFGDGYFYKEVVEKPAIFKNTPRYYSRYGMPPFLMRAQLEKFAAKKDVDAILVTSGMTYWFNGVFETIRMCRGIFPGTEILLGGIYATLFHDHAKKHSGADRVFRGESERLIVQWAREKFGLQNVKTYSGYDDYPFPAYHLYPKLDYVAMMTSRGCPYTCSFCATHEFTDHFARREPARVVDEIESYVEKGIKNITFYDDALFVNSSKHIKPILRDVIDRGICVNFHTPNGLFAKLIDPELAELLFRSGFKTIRLSYETKNVDRQKQMGKVTDSDLSRALDNLEKAGFDRQEVVVYLIMGLPGQMPSEVKESISYVHELGARASLSSFTPIPHTPEWELAVTMYNFPGDDPLRTNKSVYPLKRADFDEEAFETLKRQAVEGNQKIQSGQTNPSDYHVYA